MSRKFIEKIQLDSSAYLDLQKHLALALLAENESAVTHLEKKSSIFLEHLLNRLTNLMEYDIELTLKNQKFRSEIFDAQKILLESQTQLIANQEAIKKWKNRIAGKLRDNSENSLKIPTEGENSSLIEGRPRFLLTHHTPATSSSPEKTSKKRNPWNLPGEKANIGKRCDKIS